MTGRATSGRSPAGGRPYGNVEVKPAILNAALDLFTERGPAATSIRDIAARAGVNHGLVFRHFGTKQQLIGAVLDHLDQLVFDRIAEGGPELDWAIGLQSQLVAQASLAGYSPGELQSHFPGIALLVKRLQSQGADLTEARATAAHIVALQLSWHLFEPYLRSSADLQAMDAEQLHQSIRAAIDHIAAPYSVEPDNDADIDE
ncbi:MULTISPECIES: TetR/AcrR family transcriptional regulator [Mycolicibacter]|uniref:TetR/AcrR family transcriptional regulator n=1 Tax=Mycolicibacter TaxID=1073531 RepID=UPI000A5B473F|nr:MULTISPECIES: helix-turn-helix domain-containing protein [Mycolicibacter]